MPSVEEIPNNGLMGRLPVTLDIETRRTGTLNYPEQEIVETRGAHGHVKIMRPAKRPIVTKARIAPKPKPMPMPKPIMQKCTWCGKKSVGSIHIDCAEIKERLASS